MRSCISKANLPREFESLGVREFGSSGILEFEFGFGSLGLIVLGFRSLVF